MGLGFGQWFSIYPRQLNVPFTSFIFFLEKQACIGVREMQLP